MDSGHRPPPSGVGGSGHGGVSPPVHTPSPTTPPMQHTICNCSNNGSIDNIKKIITNAASKYPHDDLVQLILPCLLEVLLPLRTGITLLQQKMEALHNKTDLVAQASERTHKHHSPQQPSWSTIAAGGLLGHPRSQRQGPALAAVTASIALKSPPQFYRRELVAHCIKGAEALERSIPRLVEDLKRATKGSEAVGELQSVRKLQSGDVILRFDTTGSRDSWRICQNDWINILGVGAHLKERHYTVLIHGMKKRECQDPDDTIAELYRTNPRLQEAGVRILRATFQKKTLKSEKSAGPLLITVGEPEHANEMVRQEIIWRYLAHTCELFEGNAKPTQCFKCHGFGHMAMHCRQAQRCGYCSRTGHKPEDCIVKDDTEAHKCANCKGKHAAWHRECPTVIDQRTQAQVAFNNRPTRYRVDMPATRLPPAPNVAVIATQQLDISPSTVPSEGRPMQPRQRTRRTAITESSANNAVTTNNTTGEVLDRSSFQRLDGMSPRQMESLQPPPASSISHKRARTVSQRYTYTDTVPNTEETSFAKTIEAARTGAILHERRTRRGAASTMSSQSSDACEDFDTTSTTPTPMEVDP